jgi:hypothetical protein
VALSKPPTQAEVSKMNTFTKHSLRKRKIKASKEKGLGGVLTGV